MFAGRLEGDGFRCRAKRRLADQHRTWRRDRLQARRRIDDVTRDHPLPGRAQRHGRFTAHKTGSRLEPWTEFPYRVDEFQRCSHAAFRVVLVRDRGTPDRHHGIADELFDATAIALDHVAGQFEVAGQQLSDRLGIATLRERREADHVREQDGHKSTLRHRGRARDVPGRRRDGRRRHVARAVATEAMPAIAAEPGGRAVRGATRPADGRQLRAALRAELAASLARRAAGRAVHDLVWSVTTGTVPRATIRRLRPVDV